jgi:hypothetical protein
MSRDREAWLDEGVRRGWIDRVCLTHSFFEGLMSVEETAGFEEGYDPCVARWVVADRGV